MSDGTTALGDLGATEAFQFVTFLIGEGRTAGPSGGASSAGFRVEG